MSDTEPYTSPCIGVCKMDEQTDLCKGCFRTRAEIKEWRGLSEAERIRRLPEIAKRNPN